ncbi:ABC transporter ATP-binding protein [Candidatus Micrarchaeota archaeon]|nr:ABC transporter ATP-binding protein [Candidatus Micrarchaeota archaeon]
MSIISVSHLSKTFTERNNLITALDDVSLEIQEGQIFGILGPNGAGKTTLISTICGLIEPDTGKIELLGLELQSNLKELKSQINVVSGFTGILYTLNVRQALNYYSYLYGISNNSKKINELISLVGLDGYETNSADNLSSGNKQKFLIARALLNDPKLIFLDEPTVGLDVEAAINIRQLIIGLKSMGKTIILTTHNMTEAESLCDSIAIINKGKIIEIGTPDELRKKFEVPVSFELESDAVDELAASFSSIPNASIQKSLGGLKIQFPKSQLSSFLSSLSKKSHLITSFRSIDSPFDDVFLNIIRGANQ